MKTRIYFIILAIVVVPVLFFYSCTNVKKAVAFDYTYKIPRTTFIYHPALLKTGEQLIYSGAIAANLDSILNANGLSSGVVGNTTFTKCSVTIQSPDSVTFSWLQSMRGEISATSDFSAVQQVGHVTNTDQTSKTVVLTMENTNIRPYLGSKYFYFRLFATLNTAVPGGWAQMYLDGQMTMRLQPLN
ncbi:MAG: hypothetical protein WCO44_11515 [Bacteroidota bacterium]